MARGRVDDDRIRVTLLVDLRRMEVAGLPPLDGVDPLKLVPEPLDVEVTLGEGLEVDVSVGRVGGLGAGLPSSDQIPASLKSGSTRR